jgi:hypothetical protein
MVSITYPALFLERVPLNKFVRKSLKKKKDKEKVENRP